MLLHPAGVEDPASLVSFHTRYTQLNLPSVGVSAPDQADGASLSSLVASSALADEQSFNAQQDGHALHLLAAEVTWPGPHLRRTTYLRPHFRPEDDQKSASRTVVLSYGAWQRLFGGQHDVIGHSLVLDGQAYRVIGVMRSDFEWPRSRDVWVQLGIGLRPTPPENAQFLLHRRRTGRAAARRDGGRAPARTPRSATPAFGRATQ